MSEMEARDNETLSIGEQADDRAARFEDFVGQERIKDNLRVFVEAARRRGDPIDHTLFCGPPGLGKTTLALILAGERGVTLHSASGPAVEHKGQLAALLTKLEPNDVLFIDEIHRLNATVEENLYTAVEDFRIDIVSTITPTMRCARSSNEARGCSISRSPPKLRTSSRAGRGAPLASPIGCCVGRATSRRSCRTASSTPRLHAMGSPVSTSTTRASTKWTGGISRLSSIITRAVRSESKPWRLR
jgi:hypothetical protein